MSCAVSICGEPEEFEVVYLPEEGDAAPMPETTVLYCWRHARPLISGHGVRVRFRRLSAA